MNQPIIEKRRQFLPEYRELFASLFRIPDRDLQSRVLNAINSTNSCLWCNRSLNMSEAVDASTQTTEESELQSDQSVPAKRKRKRARQVPIVVKSAIESEPDPVLRQPPKIPDNENPKKPKLTRSISISTFSELDFSLILGSNTPDTILDQLPKPQSDITESDVIKQMEEEWKNCRVYSDGLLPIHEAVRRNEILALKRQLYVFKFLKIDINNLLTEENENLIELAVKANCFVGIVKELIENGIHLDCIDDNSNTLMHLAMTYAQDERLLKLLLEKTDLSLLLRLNDDGFTPLHLAVKNNRYKFCRILLEHIDKKLNIKSLNPPEFDIVDPADYSKYYAKLLESMDTRERNDKKSAILDKRDIKCGRTALFYALELKYDHLVYMLLNHLANPCIADLSGMDTIAYDAEYAQDKKISSALLNVSMFLRKSNKSYS